MWTVHPPIPAFSLPRRNNKSSIAPAHMSAPPPPNFTPSTSTTYHSQTLADLLEPAVDGPPSRESIRAFSQQLRQTTLASSLLSSSTSSSAHPNQHQHQHQQQYQQQYHHHHHNNHHHHDCQATSSSSGSDSSLQSLAHPECPQWEPSFDVPSPTNLSRRSSGRSISSNMQLARERADSVQIFGKTIFNRKVKSKRDSTNGGSSGSSSVYSQDLPSDATICTPAAMAPIATTASHGIPSLFSRRKTARDSILSDADAKKKYQISAPYNFQHLAHTDKDAAAPFPRRGSRATLHSNPSSPTHSHANSLVSLVGVQSIGSSNSSRERLEAHAEDAAMPPLSRSPPVSPSRRMMLVTSRSQDWIAQSPPRPSFPQDESLAAMLPPRISSRASLLSEMGDRPQTSSGLSQISERPGSPTDDDSDYLQMRQHRRESAVVPADSRFSRLITTNPTTANWPLPCPLSKSFEALPNVPEEEENMIARSRASMISTHSSLRGSKSVPSLWHLASDQFRSGQRPCSNASDTLGHFDFACLEALRGSPCDNAACDVEDVLYSESWEDDIDYCYEHEAEADCNYAWERPSLDLSREDDTATPVELGYGIGHLSLSSGYLHPGHLDMPALSPASQVSRDSAFIMEAVTPTTPAAPMSSANFSLPRADIQKQASQRRSSRGSHASAYQHHHYGSHNFQLSPTVLIPSGVAHSPLIEEPEWYPGQDDILTTRSPYTSEEPTMGMDKSILPLMQPRDSASTMASMNSEYMGSDRHASTASTTPTQLTGSSSSVNMQGLMERPTEETKPTKPLKERVTLRQRAKTMGHASATKMVQPGAQPYAAYALAVSRI